AEARQNQDAVTEKLGRQYGAVFGAHALMIEDPTLAGEIEGLIRDQGHAAEYAVSRVMRRHAKALESLNQGTFASRASDLFDMETGFLPTLSAPRAENFHLLPEPVFLWAHALTPSETAALPPPRFFAFATKAGGRPSPPPIRAGALKIPAVVGL